MSKEKIPMKIVIPLIVITWILSLISSLAIVFVVPSLFPVKSEQIGAGSITSDKIADEAIITVKLADGNITSAKILDGNITAVDIASGSIITVKIADGNVTAAKIADNAVTESKIATDAIVTVKLKDGSVTSAKILDGTVAAIDLASNSVITVKIADGAVTTEKIADGAVTTSKIADGNVTNTKLAAGAIPFNMTYSTSLETTSSTSFVGNTIPGMTVSINLTRNGTLVIMFSAETWLSGTGTYALYWRAMVNNGTADAQAYPNSDWIIITESADYGSHSYTFYLPDVEPGIYTVRMEWRVFLGTTVGEVNERTLVVFALPA